MTIHRKPQIETIHSLQELPAGQSAVLDDGVNLPRLVHRRADGSVAPLQGEADLAWVEGRVKTLEGPQYAQRTMQAEYWPDYNVEIQESTWYRLQKDGADLPGLTVPALLPPRPGRRWEAQVEGFLRVGVHKPGTVYVGIQTGGMGGVSGGKLFTGAGDDLIPIMQRLPIGGSEKIFFSIYTTAEGGDFLTIIPNPYPYLLVREVMA